MDSKGESGYIRRSKWNKRRILFRCSHFFDKVGEFHEDDVQNLTEVEGRDSSSDEDKTFYQNIPKYVVIHPIDWPGQNKPVDEPHCGYVGEKCASQQGRTEYAAGILGGTYYTKIILF